MRLKDLRDYCEKNEIAVKKTASREELEAAITRAAFHLKKVSPNEKYGCFGWWADEPDCMLCKLKRHCKVVSLGTDKPLKSEPGVRSAEERL
jgi:hypothetical protein